MIEANDALDHKRGRVSIGDRHLKIGPLRRPIGAKVRPPFADQAAGPAAIRKTHDVAVENGGDQIAARQSRRMHISIVSHAYFSIATCCLLDPRATGDEVCGKPTSKQAYQPGICLFSATISVMSQAANESKSAGSRSANRTALVPSPFDPYLRQLLEWAASQPQGFTQATAAACTAADFGWQPAFADALFTSARVRGLLNPYYGKGSRGRSQWAISKRGQAWLNSLSTAGLENAAVKDS
jgi:hypothetical protein